MARIVSIRIEGFYLCVDVNFLLEIWFVREVWGGNLRWIKDENIYPEDSWTLHRVLVVVQDVCKNLSKLWGLSWISLYANWRMSFIWSLWWGGVWWGDTDQIRRILSSLTPQSMERFSAQIDVCGNEIILRMFTGWQREVILREKFIK